MSTAQICWLTYTTGIRQLDAGLARPRPAQLAALVQVIQSFSIIEPIPSDSNTTLGAEVFQTHCAGVRQAGDGNGFAVANLLIPIPPTDFTRERLSMAASLRF